MRLGFDHAIVSAVRLSIAAAMVIAEPELLKIVLNFLRRADLCREMSTKSNNNVAGIAAFGGRAADIRFLKRTWMELAYFRGRQCGFGDTRHRRSAGPHQSARVAAHRLGRAPALAPHDARDAIRIYLCAGAADAEHDSKRRAATSRRRSASPGAPSRARPPRKRSPATGRNWPARASAPPSFRATTRSRPTPGGRWFPGACGCVSVMANLGNSSAGRGLRAGRGGL